MKALMKGFRVCRIFGISIELNWSLLFLVALLAWSMTPVFRKALPESSSASLWIAGISYGLLLIFSVLFHELAHSLAAKRFKIQVSRITLFILGGAAQIDGEKAFEKPAREIIISIAGPLSSFLLAGIFFGAKYFLDSSVLAYHVLSWISTINIVLAIFNLIPCFPMDGGRIFRAICFWKTRDFAKASKIARDAAVVLGILMTLGAFLLLGMISGLIMVFIVWFIIIPAANWEYQQAFLAQKLKGVKVKDLMDRRDWWPLWLAPEGVCQAEDEAIKALRKMLEGGSESLWVEECGEKVGMITMRNIKLYLKELSKQRL